MLINFFIDISAIEQDKESLKDIFTFIITNNEINTAIRKKYMVKYFSFSTIFPFCVLLMRK